MDNQQLIGERIKKARIDAGLTQEQLGEKIGYSAMGVSYLEKGLRNITIDVLQKIVEQLGLDINYLLEPIAGKAQPTQHAFFGRTSEEFSEADKKKLDDFDEFITQEFVSKK